MGNVTGFHDLGRGDATTYAIAGMAISTAPASPRSCGTDGSSGDTVLDDRQQRATSPALHDFGAGSTTYMRSPGGVADFDGRRQVGRAVAQQFLQAGHRGTGRPIAAAPVHRLSRFRRRGAPTYAIAGIGDFDGTGKFRDPCGTTVPAGIPVTGRPTAAATSPAFMISAPGAPHTPVAGVGGLRRDGRSGRPCGAQWLDRGHWAIGHQQQRHVTGFHDLGGGSTT